MGSGSSNSWKGSPCRRKRPNDWSRLALKGVLPRMRREPARASVDRLSRGLCKPRRKRPPRRGLNRMHGRYRRCGIPRTFTALADRRLCPLWMKPVKLPVRRARRADEAGPRSAHRSFPRSSERMGRGKNKKRARARQHKCPELAIDVELVELFHLPALYFATTVISGVDRPFSSAVA